MSYTLDIKKEQTHIHVIQKKKKKINHKSSSKSLILFQYAKESAKKKKESANRDCWRILVFFTVNVALYDLLVLLSRFISIIDL